MAKAKKKKLALAWSKDDVKNLRAFAKAKLSGTQIAKKLKRTPGAVSQKAMRLKVRLRSVRKKAG
jgi:IS30 family transposase